MPITESMPDFSVPQKIEIKLEGGSIWESFFGLPSEVNSTSPLWLSLMVEQIRAGRCFEDVVARWESVKQFLPSQKLGLLGDQR